MKHTLDSFTRAYIHAALWTEDPNPPGGCDYAECGAADSHMERLPDYWIEQAVEDCAAFQRDNEALLAQAGSADQNGHDFWLTRNRHGAGFWDRGYPDTVGDALTEAAQAYGEAYLCWSELTGEEE